MCRWRGSGRYVALRGSPWAAKIVRVRLVTLVSLIVVCGHLMIDRHELVETVVRTFPSVEADIREQAWSGLFHLEVSSFARYTQQQIDASNHSELKRCFGLVRRFLLEGDDDVKNAIGVSYLEHLNLRDQKKSRSWALDEMPEIVRQWYEGIVT